MAWRLAKSLEALRAQINAAAPGRSKASDGTIGDAAHASRSSDHNPHIIDNGVGVVSGMDITHDPAHGVNIQKIADLLVASRDIRIKYIICNGRIVSGEGQKPAAWKWRAYSGSNKHNKHIHVSVKPDKASYDSARPWKVNGIASVTPDDGVLRKGSQGPFVTELQGNLNRLGYPVKIDGVFGDGTEAAVRVFQKRMGLNVDGWAGPRTLKAIGEALAEKAAQPKIEQAEKTVPETATDEVERKTGWWQKVTGFFGAGGIGGSMLFGMEWQTVLAITLATIALLILLLIFKRQIISAFRDINAEVSR